ncbi:MAG TPA: CDP-alcohol phosphatidyltransferase family protein [Rubricoccaceae bacterium]|nr:CDP-alcohol phosphatidyltransferase family protein [Rubricoccaceae bacterium]
MAEQPVAKPRVNRIALARFEQWALPAMAKRLPLWVTPDVLTVVGILAALGIGVSYVLASYDLDWLWAASFLFVVNWWGDSLDGTVARVRRIQRERYGFFVDHQSDALSTLLIFGGIGVSELARLDIALAMILGYYLMMLLVDHVTIARGVFKISFGGFGPTEGRLFMMACNTAVWALGNPTAHVLGHPLQLFDGLGLITAGGLVFIYVLTGLKERALLAKLDPPRTPEPDPPVPDPVLEDAGGR